MRARIAATSCEGRRPDAYAFLNAARSSGSVAGSTPQAYPSIQACVHPEDRAQPVSRLGVADAALRGAYQAARRRAGLGDHGDAGEPRAVARGAAAQRRAAERESERSLA